MRASIKRGGAILGGIIILRLLMVLSSPSGSDAPIEPAQIQGASGELVEVTRVIDGDTIETGQGIVRLIGIDTPETVHPSKPVECMGREASAKMGELVVGKTVRLEKDVSETDRYNRLLRYIWVGDTFVNDLLVREGFASAISYPPDVKYQKQFAEAEREAREAKRGLWGNVCRGGG